MDVDERKARLLRAKQYSTLVREMFKPVAPHDDSGGSGRRTGQEERQHSKKHTTTARAPQHGSGSTTTTSSSSSSSTLHTSGGATATRGGGSRKPGSGEAVAFSSPHSPPNRATPDSAVDSGSDDAHDLSTSHLPYVSPPKPAEKRRQRAAVAAARPRRSLPTNRKLEYPAGAASRPAAAHSGAGNSGKHGSSRERGGSHLHPAGERSARSSGSSATRRNDDTTTGSVIVPRTASVRTVRASGTAAAATRHRPAQSGHASAEEVRTLHRQPPLQQSHEPAQRKLSPEQQPHQRRRPGAAQHLAVEADEDEGEGEEEVYEHAGGLTENNYGSGEAFIAKPPSPSPQALIVPKPAPIVAQLAPPLPAAAAASGASPYGNGEASELDALLAASSALAAEAEQLMAEVDTQMAEAYARADEVIRRAHQQLLRTCT